MKLKATLKLDDDDRLYAVLDDAETGEAVGVVADTAEEIVRPFKDDVIEWAAERGHEIVAWDTLEIESRGQARRPEEDFPRVCAEQ